MKNPFNTPRLLAEIVATIALAEAAVMFILPVVAPNVGGAAEAVLDATMLSLMAGPMILWRVRAAVRHSASDSPDARSASRWPLAIATSAVLALSMLATAFAVVEVKQEIEQEARARFDQLTERLVGEAQRRVLQPRYGLAGARGVYAASKSVERGEFEAYVASRNLPKEFPGAVGFGFIQRVKRTDLDAFIAAERADGAPDFAIKSLAAAGSPLDNAPDLYVIKHCFPKDRNIACWGLDIGSEPQRRMAAERAVATGEPAITGKIKLVQNQGEHTGFLYLLPVYKNGTNPRAPDERMAALVGLASAPIVLEESLAGAVDLCNGFLDFQIFDGETTTADALIFDLGKHEPSKTRTIDDLAIAHRMFQQVTVVSIGGRPWTVRTSSSPAFEATVDKTILALAGAGGTVLSVLLAGIVWTLGDRRARAVAIAQSMTADLSAAKMAAERLAEIAKRTSNAVVITDIQGRIEWINEGFTRVTGYTLDEVKGEKPGAILQGPGSDPAAVDRLRRAVASETPATVEIVNYAKDGREYTLAIELAPLRSEAGVLTGFMAIESDITERKSAEAALEASEARVKAIIDASPVPMAINEGDRITFLNPAFMRTFGYDKTDIPTLEHWWPKAYPDAAYRRRVEQSWHENVQLAKRTDTRFRPMELRIHSKSGHEVVALVSAEPIAGAMQDTVLVMLYDITDRKRTEQELVSARCAAEAASKAKSAFLANMSHEIRTPLTAILGFADILREDGNLAQAPEQRLQTIETIRGAGQHLLTVINDILDLSKIEADKMTTEKIATPLIDILRTVETLMLPRATGKGLTLTSSLDTPVPEHILTDPTRLRQILMNLVGNAVKFTDSGRVTISTRVDTSELGPRLTIDIRDTGPGLTRAQADRLFQAFGQADDSVTRKHGGTGLGLTICRRLASLMGGDVKLVRTDPGLGSCFRLVLPLDVVPGSLMVTGIELAKPEKPSGQTSAISTLSGRILLAEDGIDNQRLIAFHLRKAGARVDVADNGRIALEMLDKAADAGTPYDLLLTDMQMPEMDGYTLARTLRDRGSTLPIVALTAHAMAEDRSKCLEAKCDDYASKPIDKVALLATCAAWMGKTGGTVAQAMAA